MTWKKTWFSYILWAFYSVIICVSLSLGIILLFSQRMNRFMVIGTVCLFLMLWTAAYFLFQHFVNKNSAKKSVKKNTVEIISVVAAIVIGFVGHIAIISQVDVQQLEQSEYLINSFIQDAHAVPKVLYGAEWFFLHILRILFVFVGNRAGAALWLQFFLQLMASLLFYRGVRKTVGRVAAVISLWGLLLLSVMFSAEMLLQPIWCVFFFFAIGFYALCTVFYNRTSEITYSKGKMFFHYLRIFLLGLYIAVVIYLDLYGVLLVLFGISILWSFPVQCGKEYPQIPLRSIQVFCLVSGVSAGIISLFSLEAWCYQLDFSEVIKDWWLVYEFDLGFAAMLGYETKEILLFMLLCAVLFWGMLRFFKETEVDVFGGIFFVLIGTACLHILGTGVHTSEKIWLFLMLMLCAAICLGRCFMPVYKREALVKVESLQVETKQEQPKQVEAKEQGRKQADTKQMESKHEEEESVAKVDAIKEDTQKVKLLENPLPGPKKHVPKILDYALKEIDDFNPLDDYDLEVSEEDDYDLK